MTGVALEGGGARGAYHIGAMKALYEAGCHFDGYVGTSIGAVNAAILAQGDFELLEQLWNDITPEQLFAEPDAWLTEWGEHSLLNGPSINPAQWLATIRNGVDPSLMKSVIRGLLNERKLRASGVDFGLVTVRLDGLKAYEMHLQDIPDGLLLDYVMASTSFPGLQPEVIGGDTYIDGGLRNNCPINMLTEKGYRHVYVIRTYGPGIFNMPLTDAEITVIAPTRDLGNIMLFDNAQSRRNMTLGYLDARRVTQHTQGVTYYIQMDKNLDACELFMSIDEESVQAMRDFITLPEIPPMRLLFEHILPHLGAHLKLEKSYSYDDLALALLESAAQDLALEPLMEYSLSDLAQNIANAAMPVPSHGRVLAFLSGSQYSSAILTLARHLAEKICIH